MRRSGALPAAARQRPRRGRLARRAGAPCWRRWWHQGESYPSVGFIVTTLKRPAKRVVSFYHGRGTAEQWIREGKATLRRTRLSCRAFRANAVRLQLFALAYNLANFLRTLALPEDVAQWSLTTLGEKLINIGAWIVRPGRYVVLQLAEVAVPRALFAAILRRIDRVAGTARAGDVTRPSGAIRETEGGAVRRATANGRRGPNPPLGPGGRWSPSRTALHHGADDASALALHAGRAQARPGLCRIWEISAEGESE